ncbi:hypothetical protein M3Y95_01040100 [Aphelenchoides besseyi]|nr:hypothetical protein M3Y95_01040100 [Aphelenchoides besseyi]
MNIETVAVGFVFFVLGSIGIVLQATIIFLFLRSKNYNRNSCFRLMTSLAIADLIQLFPHPYAAVKIWFQLEGHSEFEKVLGSLGSGCWNTAIAHTVLLALNRLSVAFSLRQRVDQSLKTANLMIFVGWSFCFIFCGVYFYYDVFVIYDDQFYTWSFSADEQSIPFVEYLINVVLSVLAFLIYLLIVVILYIQRKKTVRMVRNRQERWLLLQSIFLFVLSVFIIIMWHYAFAIFPNNRFTTLATNLAGILYCSISPIIYLSASKLMRENLRRLLLSFCRPPRRIVLSTTAQFHTSRIQPRSQIY